MKAELKFIVRTQAPIVSARPLANALDQQQTLNKRPAINF